MAFKIDFSSEDLEVGFAQSYDAMPAGLYKVVISDSELAIVGESSTNAGKPMMKLTFTVADGSEFNNRKLWSNLMLFTLPNGNNFLAQFLKSVGRADALASGNVPDPEEFKGAELMVRVKRVKDDRNSTEGKIAYRNEVNGYAAIGGAPTGRAKKKGSNSLLPG